MIDAATGYLLLFDDAAAVVIDAEGNERPKRPEETAAGLVAVGYKIRAMHHTTPVAGLPAGGNYRCRQPVDRVSCSERRSA